MEQSCKWTCHIRKAAVPCVPPTCPAAATSPPRGAVARGPSADDGVPAESWGPEACVGHCGTGCSPAEGWLCPLPLAMGSLLSGAQAPFSAELPAVLQAHSAGQSWRSSVHLQELEVHPSFPLYPPWVSGWGRGTKMFSFESRISKGSLFLFGSHFISFIYLPFFFFFLLLYSNQSDYHSGLGCWNIVWD